MGRFARCRKAKGRSDQNPNAGEAAGESQQFDGARLLRDSEEPAEERDVKRNGRDQKSRETGGDILLGESDSAVPAKEETGANDQCGSPLGWFGTNCAANPGGKEKDGAG